jgi:hypothetical protein
VALSQFISKMDEQALPFFKLPRKSRPFVWTEEVEKAFDDLKRYLTSPSVMVAPDPGETLLLYATASTEVVSIVLVVEQDESCSSIMNPLVASTGSQPPSAARGPGPPASIDVGSQLLVIPWASMPPFYVTVPVTPENPVIVVRS